MKFPTRRSSGSCVSTLCAASIAASLRGVPKSEEHKLNLAEALEGRKRPAAALYTVRFRDGQSFTARGQAMTARLVTAFTGLPCNHGAPSHWTRGTTAIHPRWGILSVSREEAS